VDAIERHVNMLIGLHNPRISTGVTWATAAGNADGVHWFKGHVTDQHV
jgi:hypothetical protein